MAIIIKNEEQIEGIKRSCQLAADALRFVGQYVEEGVSTQYLNNLADKYIRNHGATPAPLNYMGFPKSICTSINEVICHGIPNDEDVLKKGDIINIDVTTILDGYYGDTSKMFFVPPISEESSELIAITQNCLNIGIHECKPGNEFYRISKAITEHAYEKGYSVVHQFCGHGVGLLFHEDPQIDHFFNMTRRIETRKMQPGMIFTIEPMINKGLSEAVIDPLDKWTARTKDGLLSAQCEHTLLITKSGVEILTM